MKSRIWFAAGIAIAVVGGIALGAYVAYGNGMYATARGPLEKPGELPLSPRASEQVPSATVAAMVSMTPFSYQPMTVAIDAGQAIRFVNAGEARQWPRSEGDDVVVDAEGFVAPGRSWYAVITKPGTYQVRDEVYPHVKATIVVR